MSTLTYTQEEMIKTAVKEMIAQTVKTPTGNPSNIYAHGPGGLLSPAGLSRGIANAMILPSSGLAMMLPARTSVMDNPLHGIFTGVTADTGDEPADRCDDPPTAGVSKLCTHTFTWGWVGRRSRELRLDRLGHLTNRGEFTDQLLVGNPLQGPDVMSLPVPMSDNPLANEQTKLLFELRVSLLRTMAPDIFTGDPSNNTGAVGASGREYYRGLDLLINTGYQDAITGQACPAADSIVRDWNNVNVEDDTTGLIEEITDIMRNLKYIARRAGLAPTKWAIVTTWGQFFKLSDIWPCSYLSYRCQNLPTGTTNFISATEQNDMRDAMRGDMYNQTGQYLLIDGERIPVIIDDGITESGTGIAGEYSSDIYFVPLTVKGAGGSPVSEGGGLATYFEYYDLRNSTKLATELVPQGAYATSPEGRFLFHKYYPVNLCIQMAGWTQPRLVLETPYLAARLQNVAYTPLSHQRSPFTDNAYFVDGGRTDYLGYGPSYYPPTS